MRRLWARVLLVLLVLAGAITGPVFYSGWRNLGAADQAAAEGRYPEAASLYEAAARQLPWRGDLWEQAGLAAYRGQNQDDAVRLLQRAGRSAPLSLNGWVALGSALWIKDEPLAAIKAWKAGLMVYPGTPALLDRLIAAYDEQTNFAEEELALTQRLAVGEEPTANYQLGLLLMQSDLGKAEAEIQKAASADPQYAPAADTLRAVIKAAAAETDNARRLVVVGRGLGLVNQWRLAFRAFDQAVNEDGSSAEAWAWLGEAQQQTGQDGLRALDEALRLGPQDAVVHSLRALFWKRQGDYSKALAEQLQAAQLDPNDAGLEMAVGQAYADAGDLVSALSAYQQATTLAPENAATWAQLASFCADNGVQVQTVGLPAALKAASLAKDDARILDTLGWSYAQAGLEDAARRTLSQAIVAEPDLAVAHLHLAEVYLRNGEYPSAQQQLEKTVELEPSGPAGEIASQLLHQYFP